jgi:hypothetical protein
MHSHSLIELKRAGNDVENSNVEFETNITKNVSRLAEL